MRRLVRLNLAQRLSRRLPRPVTEFLVAAVITSALVSARALAAPLVGDLAAFPLTMLAVGLSAIVAGWRSGAVSIVLGLLLTWYVILPKKFSFELEHSSAAFALLLAAMAELVILLALALYQREVKAGELERTRRINFLGHALREMDHRTKNNFQIVTSLLTLQGTKSGNAEVQQALREAAERLKAVSAVYDALAPSSAGLAAVRLQDQLEEICSQIRRGILPDTIALETELEPMLVPHETAVAIGIIVNELVTNACKHAFADGAGTIRVRTVKDGDAARVEVADDGRGYAPGTPERKGLGTRLIAAFVQRLNATSEVRSSEEGTVHAIIVPLRRA